MITRSRQSAVQAQMPALRQSLADFCATSTYLRRAARIDLHHDTSSVSSFVREFENESRPSNIINRLREHSRSQTLYVQILDRDQAVLVDDLSRFFVMKVRALRPDMGVNLLEDNHSLASSSRALLTSRYAPLGDSQFLFSLSIVSRILNGASIAQSSEPMSVQRRSRQRVG